MTNLLASKNFFGTMMLQMPVSAADEMKTTPFAVPGRCLLCVFEDRAAYAVFANDRADACELNIEPLRAQATAEKTIQVEYCWCCPTPLST